MIENDMEMGPCQGPLVWFDVGPGSALLECAACGYIVVSGTFLDPEHAKASLMREGLAS